MVYCEICGDQIKGHVHEIKIEKSSLNTCDKCAQYEGFPPHGTRRPSVIGEQNVSAISDISEMYPTFGLGDLSNVRKHHLETDQQKSRFLRRKEAHTKKVKRSMDIYDKMGEELVQNFYEIIHRARQSHGWTQEELASIVKEKSSLISKIERGEIVPEYDVRRKLEHTLAIKLTERLTEPKLDVPTPKEITLGEVVVIKRKKESGDGG
ncbi:MAG: TIGR00270 family protein [Methanocellales archaeon]|nr:TIGR00270 family protein [Methanocellales archaeon]